MNSLGNSVFPPNSYYIDSFSNYCTHINRCNVISRVQCCERDRERFKNVLKHRINTEVEKIHNSSKNEPCYLFLSTLSTQIGAEEVLKELKFNSTRKNYMLGQHATKDEIYYTTFWWVECNSYLKRIKKKDK